MSFFPWPEIGNFHNLRKYLKDHPEGIEPMRYLSKVKLDGTNAAIHIPLNMNGQVKAQSRTKIITPTDDNMGFARWVESQKEAWSKIDLGDLTKFGFSSETDLIIFGEWAGRGIQKNVGISQISEKIFAIFCLIFRDEKTGKVEYEVEPDTIKELLGKLPNNVYVLPWFKKNNELFRFETMIDWTASAESLQPELDRINSSVLEVESCDPWVKENFQVDGIGEGLVFYPTGSNIDWEKFSGWLFKAKGEKHKTVKQSAPAQANAEVANSVKEFADLVLTEARFEQGALEVKKMSLADLPLYDMSNVGKFLNWVLTDVKKETNAELEASKLTWDQVTKAINNQARQWYITKSKQL